MIEYNLSDNIIKKNLQKIWVILIILPVCILCFFGCGKDTNNKQDKINVVTTIFAPYDFANQIGGENVYVHMLMAPGAETHSYEPTPQDIVKISECDVFIYVGGENDEWVDGILDTIDISNIKIIKLLDCVEALKEEYVEGMEKEEEDNEEEWDEHVWTSPLNAIKICREIEKIFSELDAENKEIYLNNYESYEEKLMEIDTSFRQVIAEGNKNTIIFGDRFPVRYFTEEYGLKYYAAFPGCSSDTEASASTISFLIDKVKSEDISVILKIELSTGNIADTISEETGAKVYTFYACHNLSKADFDAGKTYLDFMWENVETLKMALN